MRLTDEILETGRSENGGWSEPQLRLLGVPWPPPKGWKRPLIGREVPDSQVSQFLALKGRHLQETRRGVTTDVGPDRYKIPAIPTRYRGVLFRSRLEARYAAFFDLVGWRWEYEPLDLDGWIPDFLVRFPCGHSECGPEHSLLVEVKPYFSIDEFEGHPCLDYNYGFYDGEDGRRSIPADASAAFGYHPRVSWWEMGHGAGGGEETISEWVGTADIEEVWIRAGEEVMYRKPDAR